MSLNILVTGVEIGQASRGVACPMQHPRRGHDGQIVPVDEAHVVEVVVELVAERDLEQRHRRQRPSTAALHPAAAVTGQARAGSGVIELAPRPRPYPARPLRPRPYPRRLPRVEPEPGRREFWRAGAGQCPRPDRVRTVVVDGEATGTR